MSILSMQEVKDRASGLKGWEIYNNMLQKRFAFRTFKESMAFVNGVAELAEAADHHPDIIVNYNRVLLKLSTHSQGGITEKDFDLAAKIDRNQPAFHHN